MKHIAFIISILLYISCHSQKDKKNDTVKKEITYIEFKQNPAEDYFFTRKYKLTHSDVFFYSNSKWMKMDQKWYVVAKKIMDSLPHQLMNKKVIGHTTVEVDIPDWTIDVYYNTQDTVFIASGGLPKEMEAYRI